MSADKPRRLGRGLGALLPTPESAASDRSALREIAVGQIRPNPFQPRREIAPEALAELEASLRTSGLLQPITVRRAPAGAGFELIAGERRLRAAERLGWTEIPALVKDVDDRELLTLALVENLQRTDLNSIEEAEGYRRLVEEFGLTQQQVAEAVGKERATVSNLLRVLALPAKVRRMVEAGDLSFGHARALLALGQDERRMIALAKEALASGLSVREVERRVMAAVPERRRPRQKTKPPAVGAGPEVRRIEDQIRSRLQTDVRITLAGTDRGTIEISFYSAVDLERVLELMSVGAREPG